MRVASAALAAVAFVAAACGGHAHGRPAHVSAARESAWVAKAQNWFATESAEGDFRHCAARTRRGIGAAPAEDLAPLERSIARMCASFDGAYRELDRAFAESDSTAYERSQREMEVAKRRMHATHALVDEWRPERKTERLAMRGGVTAVSRVEPRFGRVASAIAGDTVRVRCWSARDWRSVVREANRVGDRRIVDLWGLADPQENVIDLAPTVCRSLVDLAYRRARTATAGAFGVGVLAHEATHIKGDAGASEATTECYGMQRAARVARLLGAHPARARLLSRWYAQVFHSLTPPDYHSRDCRPNGPLDLTPGDGRWP